ncbi:hypothetical protein VA596_01785 [Amycolatopsis sp., V23-08]|uniref:Uncharacterized protein n=1 Tax=Amycolatopsis heterodermiae TaxID=3110235 RepID=A0ABU5QWF8_9PSEU|nr:hypothetical protein [Amycolatopsis sp., V23-08]MEA5358252.1 hypothetical protein [Amycolatopsis sp., V23-08]
MSDVPDEGERVPDEETANWAAAAHTARLAGYVLDQVVDPVPGSMLAADDAAYRWEKCSAWMRSSLVAALDHLTLWANIVAPQKIFEGMIVRNPPRPYFTLARAGLESAAQAVWVLKEDDSTERVHRHLRLLYHDLRQMALAFEKQGDDRAPSVRDRMNALWTRVGDMYPFESIVKGEPKYSSMVHECAAVIDMQPNALEVLWRGASAAAHGKNWFQYVAYSTEVGSEYEPGYFRTTLRADPKTITESITAAANMVLRGVLLFVARSGRHPQPLYAAAFAKLVSETPLKDVRNE